MNQDNNYDRDKLEGQELTLIGETKFAKWISNFWYHHKWTVIIVTFFLSILVIVGVQMLTRVKYDSTLTFAGNYSLTSDAQSKIAYDLESIMGKDMNGDGEKRVSISHYPVYSESQMKEANKSQKDANGVYIQVVDGQSNTTQFNQFFNFTASGDSSIFFLSEYLYNVLKQEGRLLSLSEVFGDDLPKGAMKDGYGVKLTDSSLYERFSSFEALPEDTVICIAKPLVWGNSSKEKEYAKTKEYFIEMLK